MRFRWKLDHFYRKILAQSIQPEQLATIQEFTKMIAMGMDEAEYDHSIRRSIIEAVTTQVTLVKEDGKKVAYASCIFGGKKLSLATKST